MDGERASIDEAQRSLNTGFDILRNLPPYCDLPMGLGTDYNAPLNLEEDDALWNEVMAEGSERRRQMRVLFQKLETLSDCIIDFRVQVFGMLELYFEDLLKQNENTYGRAFAEYYQGARATVPLFFSEWDVPFEQSFDVSTRFIPIRSPEKEGKVVAGEETLFDNLATFLYVDFYRGMIRNNISHRCLNYGRYFLLTAGCNTCYCNNIAPGETERTCRKVGANRKEAQGKANRTPAQKDYARTYNRLKARKQRGKGSEDEWNAAVAQAQHLLEQNERGELTGDKLKMRLDAM